MRSTHTFVLKDVHGDCHFDVQIDGTQTLISVYQFDDNSKILWTSTVTFEELRELARSSNSVLMNH